MSASNYHIFEGRFLLNGVQRPTSHIETTDDAIGFIERQTSKRNFVDITLESDGRLGVRSRTDATLIGYIKDAVYAVYGDLLLQVIESGYTPQIEATSELIGDFPSVSLHLRENPEELVWGDYKRRPTPEQLARRAEQEELFARPGRRSQAIAEYESNRKKGIVAWLLWLFLGALGAHRFYFGHTGYAVAMLLLGWATLGIWPLLDGIICNNRNLRSQNRALWERTALTYAIPSEPFPESAQ